MIRQWFGYLWVVLFGFFSKNLSVEENGHNERLQNLAVLACFVWEFLQRRSNSAQQAARLEETGPVDHPTDSTVAMEIVPVEEKMNQVAESAPSVIGRVIESEVDTNEESTSSEVTHDSDKLKHKEQTEEYEAKGTAKIVGTQGSTVSSAEAKSKQSDSVTEKVEGDRKVLCTKSSSSKSYSFEETTEYESED